MGGYGSIAESQILPYFVHLQQGIGDHYGYPPEPQLRVRRCWLGVVKPADLTR